MFGAVDGLLQDRLGLPVRVVAAGGPLLRQELGALLDRVLGRFGVVAGALGSAHGLIPARRGGPSCPRRYGRRVSWSTYASFLVFAVVLVLVPGPDFAVVTKNTLAGGRRRGLWSAVGVSSSNALQGIAAAAGLGAVVVRAQPLFHAVKWAGIAYLAFLGVQAFRSALAGRYPAQPGDLDGAAAAVSGWRQGFLSNITNPKVLVFYLAVLPQFLGPHAPLTALVVLALSHAVLSLLYLTVLVAGMQRARSVLTRRRVRRALDAATGAALVGFGARLATE
jgi:threonine/homoserine/homoserine lactone efflux protein